MPSSLFIHFIQHFDYFEFLQHFTCRLLVDILGWEHTSSTSKYIDIWPEIYNVVPCCIWIVVPRPVPWFVPQLRLDRNLFSNALRFQGLGFSSEAQLWLLGRRLVHHLIHFHMILYDFIWFHDLNQEEIIWFHQYIYTLIKINIYIYYQYHINIIEYNTSKYCQFGTSKSWSWGGWLGALPLLRWWTSECTHDPFVSIPCDEITVEIRQVGTPIHRRVLPLTQGAKCTAWSLPVAIVAIVMP
jgi:hypothetical protein